MKAIEYGYNMKRHIKPRLNPPPPPYLSQDKLALWTKWVELSDKTVIHEAANKGPPYVDLAVTFLSLRSKLPTGETRESFNKEVVTWANELLRTRKYKKALDVLTNAGLDVCGEVTNIFCDTSDIDLREYLGSYLKAEDRLDADLVNSWNLLKKIIASTKKFNIEYSVTYIHKQLKQWKSNIACKLYAETLDFDLEPMLIKELLWKKMIDYRKTESLLCWINEYFKADDLSCSSELKETAKKYFRQSSITLEMIEIISKIENNNEMKNKLLNALANFAIFTEKEHSLPDMLQRFKQINCLEHYEKSFEKTTLSLKLQDFQKHMVQYLTKENLFSILNYFLTHCKNLCDEASLDNDNPNVELINDVINLFKNINNSEVIIKNIIKVAKYLNTNLNEYFTENPILIIAIYLLRNIDFKEEISIDDFVITKGFIENAKRKLPLFNLAWNKIDESHMQLNFTYHNLMEKQLLLKANEVFGFQLDNRISISNITNSKLSKEYGYNKPLNFEFFICQGRPTLASYFFIKENMDEKGNLVLTEDAKKEVSRKMFCIAMKHFKEVAITTSVVMFLQFLGINNQELKIHIRIAELISNTTDDDAIKTMMLNVYCKPQTVFDLAEEVILKLIIENEKKAATIDVSVASNSFVPNFKLFDLLMQFNKIHNLTMPEKYLQRCAQKNMWLQFLTYIQCYNYPVEQCRKLAEYFEDKNLVEHLQHAIVANVVYDGELMRERNVRSSYLARVGVRRNEDSDKSLSLSSHSSVRSCYEEVEDTYVPHFTNLLSILIKAHNSADPPRSLMNFAIIYKNPLCAILAVSYEPDCYISAWMLWLIITCNLDDNNGHMEGIITSAKKVKNVLLTAIQLGHIHSILISLKIFMPDHALILILEALIDCINFKQYKTRTVKCLEKFSSKLNNMASNTVMIEYDAEQSYLNNKIWVKNLTCDIICSTLHFNFHSKYSQIKFLQFLVDVEIEKHLEPLKIINSVQNILQTLGDYDIICSNFDLSVILNEAEYKKEVMKCCQELLSMKMFTKALQVAKFGDILYDFVLVEEWEHNFATAFELIENFWDVCNENLQENKIAPQSALNFYINMLEKCYLNKQQQYKILLLAYDWCVDNQLIELFEVERSIWSIYIYLKERKIPCERLRNPRKLCLVTFIGDVLEGKFRDISRNDLPCYEPVESDQLLQLMELLLEEGNIYDTLKLQKLFGYQHLDAKIITICMSLAEGVLTSKTLTTEHKMILQNGRIRRNDSEIPYFQKLKDVNISVPSPINNVPVAPEVTLEFIEKFSKCLVFGHSIGKKIFRLYRITVYADATYQELILTPEPMAILKNFLLSDFENKIEVVSDFVEVYDWTKEEFADFVCDELIAAINEYVRAKKLGLYLWDSKLDDNFHRIYQLKPDNCSILGYKLYTFATAMFSTEVESGVKYKIQNFISVIELYIRSHDCFTYDCNMEGITMILKKCHHLVQILVNMKEWKYIVRLLTGVGRYTEMSYVLEILYANEQFEYLLTQSSNKDAGLKVALLEYLKKNCPDNNELYKMVALHFALYSEVAALWMKEAENTITRLVEISKLDMECNKKKSDFVMLNTTDETKLLVLKAMDYYSHAAEYHILGDKMLKAMSAAKSAELLALQTYLLKQKGPVYCILQLKNEQILHLISSTLDFQQALILIEAYNYEVDWAHVLFERCITQNHDNFLDEFLENESLTEDILMRISNRYVACNVITETSTVNMRKLVKRLNSVHTKYRLASKLSFTDIIEDLLEGNQLAYLKDTVWKQGYHGEPFEKM